MKPRNFSNNKFRRQVRAYERLFKPMDDRQRVLLKQSHEAFVLQGIVGDLRFVQLPSKDIRQRIGKKRRDAM